MRVRHKPWAYDYLRTLPFYRDLDNFDFAAFIANSKHKIAIEIGVGKGDYLLAMAKKHEDIIFFGIELNASVLSVAAKKFEEAGLFNIFITNADALLLMPKLNDNSVDYIILNHSDPWPKKRHEKRRLTHPKFMSEYFRILKEGSAIYFKSDNDDLSNYTYEVMNTYPFIDITFNQDYSGDAPFDARTEYETKFTLKGVKIKRIVGKK